MLTLSLHRHQVLFWFLSVIILTMPGIANCKNQGIKIYPDLDRQYYRQEMRNFILFISNYSHDLVTDFIIIPQNRLELLTTTGEPDGPLDFDYISSIDGVPSVSFVVSVFCSPAVSRYSDSPTLLLGSVRDMSEPCRLP